MKSASTEWSRELRYLVLAVGMILFWFFMKYMGPLLPPLIIGALMAYLLSPLVGILHHRLRVPRTLAVVIVYSIAVILIFVVLPLVGVPLLIQQGRDLQDEILLIIEQLDKNLHLLAAADLPFELERIPEIPYDLISEQLNPDRFFNLLGYATKNLLYFLLIMFSSLFFLLDWPRLKKWMLGLWPQRFQQEVTDLLEKIIVVWNAYLKGQLLMALLMGVSTWLALVIMGVRSALALALLSGVGDMLPKMGPMTALIVISLVALYGGSSVLGLSNFWFFILVLIVTTLIQGVGNFIVRPRILGDSLHIHPGVVIVAIISALTLSGVVLALIAVPLVSTVEVLLRYFWRKVFFYEEDQLLEVVE